MYLTNGFNWAAPMQQGLNYTIEGADPQKSVTVNICGGDTADPSLIAPSDYTDINYYVCTLAPLGVKRLAGQATYTINVAPYFRHLANVQPLPAQTDQPTQVEGRAIVAALLVDDTLKDFTIMYTVGSQSNGIFMPMSDPNPRRTLSVGERCEVSITMWPANYAVFEAFTETGKQLMQMTLAVDSLCVVACPFVLDESVGNARKVYLWVTSAKGRHLAAQFEVSPRRSARAVRLAWQNPYGAVDYHTFERTVGEQLVVEKALAQAADGLQVYSCTIDNQITLQSEMENALTLRHLAQVLSAPRVWLCNADGTHTRVDVLTRSTAIALDTPGRLNFVIRNAAKTVLL